MSSNLEEIAEKFPTQNRNYHVTCCSVLTTVLAIVFGALNLKGYADIKTEKVMFNANECEQNNWTCTKTIDPKISDKTFVYLYYPFVQTSFFVYMKGLHYSDLFGTKEAYFSDNKECFPIENVDDYYDIIIDQLKQNPLDMVNRTATNGNDKLVPCGLKAALFKRMGTLEIMNGSDTSKKIMLDKNHLVDKSYTDLLKDQPNSYIDVKDPDFLSWYLPQVPGFGLKVFMGSLDKVSESIQINVNLTNAFFDRKSVVPEVWLLTREGDLSKYFSNLTFGIILLSIGVASLFVLMVHYIIARRKSS